nr:transposase, MuDR, MULE transposase domain protein [Tanacetum cinerariifolium]
MNVSMYYRSGNHGVLLAKDINYSQLLEHVKQRFRIEDDYVTRLSFFLDFDHTDSVVSSGSNENVSFVHSKSEEDCVNPGFNYAWKLTNTFKHTPTLPSTPLLVIKPLNGKLSDRECARTFKVGDEFDDKDDSTFQLDKKALFEGFKQLVDAGFDKWSRAHCPGNRYNYMTSNSAKCIHSLTRVVQRVPITMKRKRVPGFELENGLVKYLVAADTAIMDAFIAKWRELPNPRRFCNDSLVDELVNRAKNEVEYDEEVVKTQKQIEIELTLLERASQDEANEDNWHKNEVEYDEEAVET